jgi:hypothetical protein
MQSLSIFGAMEGVRFEFNSLNWFLNNGKILKPGGAHSSVVQTARPAFQTAVAAITDAPRLRQVHFSLSALPGL